MKNRETFILCLAVLGLLFVTNSCKMIDNADKHFEYSEYTRAIPLYKKVLDKDSTLTDAWAKLGDCYRLNNQTIEAESCYEKVVNDSTSANIYKLFYAQMLINNTKYDEAEVWIEKYRELEPGDTRGYRLEAGIKNLENFLADKELYQVQKISVNSDESDYGPVFFKDGLLFNSSRKSESWANRQDSWTGKRFFSVYYAQGKDATFEEPVIFMKGMQTKYNNSSVCFNGEGNEMIMTRNNIENGEAKRNKNRTINLKLYISEFKNGIWAEALPFEYNSDDYSCAQPALSKDGTKLIFSSDMPGSIGGMDLWTCTRNADGWSEPVNLGHTVNTEGNEVFPTISDNGIIYFSSNGYGGLGGLDIFLTADSAGSYTKPKNAGFPVNSPDDDFGLIWDSKNNVGYFTSNRINQGYNDDIFVLTRSAKLVAKLFDRKSEKLIGASRVTVIEEGGVPESTEIGKNGNLKKGLNRDKNYLLVVDHDQYKKDTIRITSENLKANQESYVVDVPLEKEPVILTVAGVVSEGDSHVPVDSIEIKLINLSNNDTLIATTSSEGVYTFNNVDAENEYRLIADGKSCVSGIIDTTFKNLIKNQSVQVDISLFCMTQKNHISNIYYDLNKSNIRKDATAELDKLARLMQKYPNIEIELASHTDSRASYLYNMKLSQDRAKAAVEYLVKKGINKKRLTGRGYGESKPVNQCKGEGDVKVYCTEHEHQLNRRTEIIIISREWTAVAE